MPRDAGTCTRCPFECRLSYSPNEWRCKISIRWEFDDFGDRRDEVREEQFGEVITTPEDVEIALRRVQTAVLNPKLPSKQFVDMGVNELKRAKPSQLPFSRNAVCVDLSGPQMADIAFVDLPGKNTVLMYDTDNANGSFCRNRAKRGRPDRQVSGGSRKISHISQQRQLSHSCHIAYER